MATVAPTIVNYADEVYVATWALTTANGDGAPITALHNQYADRTGTFVGTNWGGAVGRWEGSNDGSTWFVIRDPFGDDASSTSDFMSTLTEMPLYVRPNLSTAGTAAVVSASLCMRRPRIKT